MQEKIKKTVLITGGSRGIGKAIALKFGEAGYNVVINYLSSSASAEEIASQIKNSGGSSLVVKADVSKKQDLENLIQQTVQTFGRLDVLVNNAGITKDNLLIRMSKENWQAVIETNFLSVFELTEMASEIMKKQGSGKIINMSSVAGTHGNAGQANYSTAKAGVVSLTKIKARELAPIVQVNAIAPGLIETDMTASFDLNKLANTKLGRAGKAKEIADCVFMLAESGDYITGQVIEIDGGLSLLTDVKELVS